MAERFSASNAAKHMACHASANLELAIPNYVAPVDETRAASVGTDRHDILARVNEMTAREMKGFASVLDYIADLRSTRRFKVLIEESITATWLPSQPKTTVDLVLYTQDEIHVLDYKNGKIPVEVVGNEQLLYYALCFAPLAPKAKGATLHILQPNGGGNSSWFADATTLKQFMDEAIATDIAIANKDLTFGPSDHCTFCPANPHTRGTKGHPLCPALMQIYYPKPFDEDELLSL
jgi:hypothetical protein